MNRARIVCASILLLAQSAVAQSPMIVIHAKSALDGTGKSLGDVLIFVEGTKISRIEPARAGARRADYELGSLVLMPGLIDGHSHLAWYFNRKG
ncbi:MAG TPA: hypothetical protein VNC11_01930, partial [Gemmatimonadaceae bacterium]|nr:hypothetical protein [Gemmatimonadaceae bacterium]